MSDTELPFPVETVVLIELIWFVTWEEKGDLYVQHKSNFPNKAIVVNARPLPFNVWHYKLGNSSYSRLSTLHSTCPFISIDNNSNSCDVCSLAKQKEISFPISQPKSVQSFELIHVDIWGHFSITSINGHKYFLTVVNDHNRYIRVFLMKHRQLL